MQNLVVLEVVEERSRREFRLAGAKTSDLITLDEIERIAI